ncbi:hypothetical protein Dimus_009297 [Dionaea muscipula]
MDDLTEFQIPSIVFYPQNAANLWCCLSIPDLHEAGKLPLIGDKDDKIDCIAGLEGVLRAKDLTCEYNDDIIEVITRTIKSFVKQQQEIPVGPGIVQGVSSEDNLLTELVEKAGRCLCKWFNAVDLKEYLCERGVISMVINEVMEDRKDELMESARVMSTLANKAVGKGGTSYNNLDSLVEHIQLKSRRASASKQDE